MKRKNFKLLSGTKQLLFALAMCVSSGAAYSQTTYTFNYSGNTQTISLPAGNYSVECWGAAGGNATDGTVAMFGGKGGYSRGVFFLANTTTVNVYVGGKGGNASGNNVGGGGGGMSDIAPSTNTNAVIIVAGGGGGAAAGSASESSTGGDGGGLTGGTAIDGTGVSTGTAASGGSQTAGGIALAGSYGAGTPGGFGYGGGASNGGTTPPSPAGVMHGPGGIGGNGGNGGWNGGGAGGLGNGGNDHAAGGGAGYYGGGGGRGDGGAGGGGSSYIGGLSSAVTYSFGETGFIPNPDVSGNGLVLIKELCSISLSVSGLNSNGAICAGNSVTITTNAISNYSWTNGSTAASIVVAPGTSSVYGLSATSPSNCTTSSQVTVDVSPTPALNIVNSTPVICLGNQAVITAGGADTYSWSTNSTAANVTVSPSQSTTYSVTGTNTLSNCSRTETVTVDVITVNVVISGNSSICKGSTTTLTANSAGATSYSWSTGVPMQSLLVSPATHTIYVATAVVQTLNTICYAISSVTVTVNDKPNIIAIASKPSMCVNEAISLSAGGGTAYAWSWGTATASGAAIAITPTVNNDFVVTVTGTGTNGCTNSSSVAIEVSACTSIGELSFADNVKVYPNPSHGDIIIQFNSAAELELINETGQQVYKISLNEANNYKANLSGLDEGIYFIKGQNGMQHVSKKIIITR